MSDRIATIKKAIVEGKHTEIETMVREAIGDKTDLDILINEALIGAMDIVGKMFAAGEIFVPEMLVSAATMKKGLALIKPLLTGDGPQSKGAILILTVKGDLHDIGKNLVTIMLEGAGFNVLDLGVDLSAEKVISKVEELKPDILALSALLTTTMPEMEKVIKALESRGLRDGVKVMVGGAPVDSKFADKIGADGYGKDAGEAVQLAKTFLHLS
ncbi:MAG: corrinoid protein [Syntrophobacteraceae bacterium]|jgi:5-methyltetrahydrofolate--homocysteine methyltransferase